MEKLILKRISAMLISIFIIISLSGTIGIFLFKNKVINKDIADMIFQIENTYEENKLNIEITKNFFLDDYFNKAYAVDYILSNNPDDNLNAESLKKIKELMEVETINILDKNGVVVLSSNHESIGLDLLNSKEAYPFWNLINGKDEEDKVAQLNAISIINKEEKIYIGIKASLEEYSIIQIGLDRSVYNDLIHIYSIEHLVNNIPTVYEKTIFAVDKNTGELCGLTKNNSEKIVLDDVNSKEEFRDKLYELTGGDVVKVNDKYMYMKTRIIDDYIVGAYIDLYSNYKLLSLNIIILIIGLITAFIVIILIVKKSINKYILNDVLNMEKNIIKLINGEYDIEFKTKYNTEIKRINFI